MRSKELFSLGAVTALLFALLAATLGRPWTSPANTGDLLSYHYPLRHLSWSAVQSGRLPFWNPYIFAGLPLAADPQCALYYPPALLGAVLPLASAFSWDFFLHLCWAAWGAALLARAHGTAPLGAAAAGGIYALSPFLAYRVYQGIPTVLASLAWAPWCWLFWLSGSAPLLAAAWALQWFSGHPQFAAINGAAMLVWGLSHARRARLTALLVVGGLGAAALSAALWLPLLEFLRHSMRSGWPEGFTTAYSVEPRTLLCALWPGAFGEPVRGTFAGPPSVFIETTGLWLGSVGLAFAVWGIWRGARRPLWLAGLGIFLALGGRNPLYVMLLRTPLGWLRTPARYLFMTLWALWLSAAGAWRGWRGGPGWLKSAAAAACVLELACWDARFMKAQDDRPILAPHAGVIAAAAGRPWRVLTDPELANADKTMLYRAMNVNGYAAFYLAGFPEYARRSEGRAAVDASRSYLARPDSPEMKRLAVRELIEASGAVLEVSGALPLAYFVDGAGRPVDGGRGVAISVERPERWRVTGNVPAHARGLVAAQPLYPGWRATLDGRAAPLEAWDGWLQSIVLPTGAAGRRLEWRLDFAPTGWPWLVLLSAAGWLVWTRRRARAWGAA